MSYSILQRFADAGIQPLTHHAGLAISTQFKLSEKGNRRVRDALDNLRASYGFDSVLWFGFGHKSFLGLLTERELGVNCAALCACLGETYGTPKAAELLQNLWEVNDFPKDLQPSRSQFGALVSGCSGLFVSTPFAEIVQRMAGPYKPHIECHVLARCPSPSTDLAATINGLFQVSTGRLKAIDIHGGSDIAFLSAVAYWLFDLCIWVQMRDGSVLFSNCSYPEEAVVRLHYVEGEDPLQRSLIKISATTFVLGSVQELIAEEPHTSIIFRANWETCLTQTFGHEVKRIQDQASLLGKALGAIARIYEAIAKCEVDVGGISRLRFVNFQPRGYGRSFVSSIATTLPEIGSHQNFMDGAEQSLSQNVANSVTTIYDLIMQFQEHCPCPICAKICAAERKALERKAWWKPWPKTSERRSSKRKTLGGIPSELKHYWPICNVAALLFLRKIGDIMAHVKIDLPIAPTIQGLHCLYGSQYDLCHLASQGKGGSIAQRKIYLLMAMGMLRDDVLPHSGTRNLSSFLLDSILEDIALLYTGTAAVRQRTKPYATPLCTAWAANGVCIWLDALRVVNADPSSMSTIHVMAGQISYRNRVYSSVEDLCKPTSRPPGPMVPPAIFAISGASADLPMHVSVLDLGLQALVTERLTEGTLGFAFQIRNRSDLRYLHPGILTEALLAFTGTFPCSKSSNCSTEISVPCYTRKFGWDFDTRSRNQTTDNFDFSYFGAFLLWAAHDPISKLLAIEGLYWSNWEKPLSNERHSLYLLASGQCMACLARYWQESMNTVVRDSQEHPSTGTVYSSDYPEYCIHII